MLNLIKGTATIAAAICAGVVVTTAFVMKTLVDEVGDHLTECSRRASSPHRRT